MRGFYAYISGFKMMVSVLLESQECRNIGQLKLFQMEGGKKRLQNDADKTDVYMVVVGEEKTRN